MHTDGYGRISKDMHASAIFPKMQEPSIPLVPYELQLLQGKMKIQVSPENRDLTGKYQVKSTFLLKT